MDLLCFIKAAQSSSRSVVCDERLGLELCKEKGPLLFMSAKTSLCMPEFAGVESVKKEPQRLVRHSCLG